MMVLLLSASVADAAEFQADVVDSREVVTRKGHIWFKDGTYRLQMEATSGPDQYLLVDAKNATTQVVFPKYKAYMEVPGDDFMALMSNPFGYCQINCVKFSSANFCKNGRLLATFPMDFDLQRSSIFKQTKVSKV